MGHCLLTPAIGIKQAPVHCSWRNQVFSLTLLGVSWSCSEGCKDLWRFLVGRTVSEVALSKEVLVMCGDSSQRVRFLDSWEQLHRGQLGPAKPGHQWSREQVRRPHQGDEEKKQLGEPLSAEEELTCRRADGGPETNAWFIRKVTTRTNLLNFPKRYLMEHDKRMDYLYLFLYLDFLFLRDNSTIIWK